MSINLFSLALYLDRIAVVVIPNFTQYFVAPLVSWLWTSNALHCHIPQDTDNIIIPSLFVILLKIIPMNITVISVRKKEIQSISSTTVQIAVILLISIVFWGNTQIACFELLTHLSVTHTPLFLLRKLKTILNVTVVVIFAKS